MLNRFKLNNISKKNLINLIILCIYIVILIIVAFHHEPWRDEAQSWLISRDLSLKKIIFQLKYEGHPFGWYYFLKIFTTLGLQYNYIVIIPVFLNIIATYIILKKSRFNTFTNIVIIFSSCLFYYCGILARSYSLVYLLISLLISIYRDRYKKNIYYGILLYLIMNTHILLLGFVCSLILIDIYEFIKNKNNRKKIAIVLLIFVLGIISLLFQFFTTMESTGIHVGFNANIEISNLFMQAIENQILYVITIISIYILAIYLVCKRQYKDFIILSCGLLFQILFAILIYSSKNCTSLIYLNILFVVMQTKTINRYITTITIIIFASSIYGTYYLVNNDLKYSFSDAQNVSKYIVDNLEKGSKIYCELLDYCSSINAYLPKNKYHFIDYNTKKEYTYTNYGDYLKVIYNQTLYNDSKFFYDDVDYYIGHISNKENLENKDESNNYKLIYETDNEVFYSSEEYVMYKKNKN